MIIVADLVSLMILYCRKKLEVVTALLSVQLPRPSTAKKSAVMGHAFLTRMAEQRPFFVFVC